MVLNFVCVKEYYQKVFITFYFVNLTIAIQFYVVVFLKETLNRKKIGLMSYSKQLSFWMTAAFYL